MNINKLNNIIILAFFCSLLIFKLYLKYRYLKINTLLTVIPIPVAAKGPYTCKNAVNGNCIITLTIIPITANLIATVFSYIPCNKAAKTINKPNAKAI